MIVLKLILWMLAAYGLYRLAIKMSSEKQVDDEVAAIEAKAKKVFHG